MSAPTNENGLALAAVDSGGSTRRRWARAEAEGSPQGPQQVQRPAQKAEEGVSGRRRWAVAHGVCEDTYSRDPRET